MRSKNAKLPKSDAVQCTLDFVICTTHFPDYIHFLLVPALLGFSGGGSVSIVQSQSDSHTADRNPYQFITTHCILPKINCLYKRRAGLLRVRFVSLGMNESAMPRPAFIWIALGIHRLMGSKRKASKSMDDTANTDRKLSYIVPAVDRAVRILTLLRNERREMTIAEISEAMECNKSSIYKLLLTLDHHSLLARDPITKRYSLGVALMEFGRAVLSGFDIQHAAKPSLKALTAFSGETTALSILRGTKLTILEVEESTAEVRVSLAIGMTSPATATSSGKAILAYLPEKQRNEILRIEGLAKHAKGSITNPALYQKDLESIRKRGYSTDYEEFQEGIMGISAPVFSSKGVIGAIAIVLPAFKATKVKTRKYGKKCAEEAARLSTLLL